MSDPVVWSGYVNDYYDDSIKQVTVYKSPSGAYVYEGDELRDDIHDLVTFTKAYGHMSTLHVGKIEAALNENVVSPEDVWPE